MLQFDYPRRTPKPTRAEFVREVRDVLTDLPRFATAPLYRHWHQRWGATDEEVAGAMPGDDIIERPLYRATRAISIAASPKAVCHGWYRWAASAAASTPTTCSTILPTPAHARFCPSTSN